MLAEEKLLFHETVKMLSKYKHNILTQVCAYQMPTVAELTKDAPALPQEPKPTPKIETPAPTTTTQNTPETTTEDANETVEENPNLTVEFTSKVPKFLGKEREIYGPYEEGMTADLPPMIANILIKKGKVKLVES